MGTSAPLGAGAEDTQQPQADFTFYNSNIWLLLFFFFFYICSPCPVMCLSVSFKHYLPLEHKQFIAREPLYAKHGLRAIFHPLTYVNTIYSQEAQRAVPAPRLAKLCTHNLTENLKNGERLDAKSAAGINQEGPPAPPGHVAIRRSWCTTSHPPKGTKRFPASPKQFWKGIFLGEKRQIMAKQVWIFALWHCFVTVRWSLSGGIWRNDG